MKLVLTCEHAGNSIPKKYQNLFPQKNVLQSHRGYDPGAFDLFEYLIPLSDFNKHNKISRLLIEVNRSLGHKSLFSEFSKQLSEKQKQQVLNNIYRLYRYSVEEAIQNYLSENEEVLHVSIHSFTPELQGKVRNADMGLLYDPSRKKEKEFCHRFKAEMLREQSNLKIRYNYPYLGKADGFTTYLRKKFLKNYLGIELEINQKFEENNKMPPHLKTKVFDVISKIIK